VTDGSDFGIVWAVSDASFATVDQHGLVKTKNKTGLINLTATDPESGIISVIALRIA
jgi:hypothetical protein